MATAKKKSTPPKPTTTMARRGVDTVKAFVAKLVGFMTPVATTSGPDVDVPAGWEDADEAQSSLLPAADWQEPGEYVAGEYLGFVSDIGPNKSRQYRFKLPTDELVCIWGTTILDQRMDTFNPARGDNLLVQYKGDVPTGRGLNPAKDFRIRRK